VVKSSTNLVLEFIPHFIIKQKGFQIESIEEMKQLMKITTKDEIFKLMNDINELNSLKENSKFEI